MLLDYKHVALLLALLALVVLGLSLATDGCCAGYLQKHPLTTNFISGVTTVPATALLALLLIDRARERQALGEKRRQAAVLLDRLDRDMRDLDEVTRPLRRAAMKAVFSNSEAVRLHFRVTSASRLPEVGPGLEALSRHAGELREVLTGLDVRQEAEAFQDHVGSLQAALRDFTRRHRLSVAEIELSNVPATRSSAEGLLDDKLSFDMRVYFSLLDRDADGLQRLVNARVRLYEGLGLGVPNPVWEFVSEEEARGW